jgi:4-hydroxybenzoate polyprenyltransferase
MQGPPRQEALARGRPLRPAAALVALRPRQWTKNLLVLAPVFFSQRAVETGAALQALAAAAAFCLLSGAVYVANDLVDVEGDRAHPAKRTRPIASGEVGTGLAVALAATAAAIGLGLSLAVGRDLAACAAVYVGLQALYTLWMKHVVVLDVFGIASGFVLRVVAGAAAVEVPVSHWLYLCTLLLALFLALAKRRAEIVLLEQGAAQHRRILAEYSLPFIDQLVSIVCGSALVAYSLYTVADSTTARVGNDRLKYTIPLVLLGVFRYLYLMHQRGGGGEPDLVLLRDRPLQLALAGYVAIAAWALYL